MPSGPKFLPIGTLSYSMSAVTNSQAPSRSFATTRFTNSFTVSSGVMGDSLSRLAGRHRKNPWRHEAAQSGSNRSTSVRGLTTSLGAGEPQARGQQAAYSGRAVTVLTPIGQGDRAVALGQSLAVGPEHEGHVRVARNREPEPDGPGTPAAECRPVGRHRAPLARRPRRRRRRPPRGCTPVSRRCGGSRSRRPRPRTAPCTTSSNASTVPSARTRSAAGRPEAFAAARSVVGELTTGPGIRTFGQMLVRRGRGLEHLAASAVTGIGQVLRRPNRSITSR